MASAVTPPFPLAKSEQMDSSYWLGSDRSKYCNEEMTFLSSSGYKKKEDVAEELAKKYPDEKVVCITFSSSTEKTKSGGKIALMVATFVDKSEGKEDSKKGSSADSKESKKRPVYGTPVEARDGIVFSEELSMFSPTPSVRIFDIGKLPSSCDSSTKKETKKH